MEIAFLLSTTSCMLLLTSFLLSTFVQSSFVPFKWTPEVSSSGQCGLAFTNPHCPGEDTSSLLSTFAQSSFIPVEWTPQVSPSGQCGLAIASDLSDALATVTQLVKSTTSSSSLPKSCMEIKESSPGSPSGYYTISNGTGNFAIVYCDTNELYSCLSLEQTLKEFSNFLTGVSNTLTTNDTCDKISISCQEVLDKCPKCTSGYYKILAADLTEKFVHCNFEEKCGIAGPWIRVAFLNMSDCSSVCPSGTQKFACGSVVACGLQEPSSSKCISITTSMTHSYTQICGQVAGYQKGSGDGFYTTTNNIDGIYVDGVSITRGSPRQHVWSYAIGHQENFYYETNPSYQGRRICACGETSIMQVPSFVGSDYYCESGCPGINNMSTIYSDDVLWDGQQCGDLETGCCTLTSPGQPWFHKVLNTPSIDSIEIRLCIDESTTNENVLVSLYEMYVK